jgi:hypothetical protein
MTRILIATVVIATAAPALAFDLPWLTFPAPQTTTSTSNGR